MKEATFSRSPHEKKNPYTMLLVSVLQNPNLSLEGKGYYGMHEAGAIEWHKIPEKFRKEILIATSDEVEE